jgi:pyridoxal phosphate enzyme (YggS family)
LKLIDVRDVMLSNKQLIQENVAEIRGRMAEAAARSGRASEDVLLVGVTKYVTSDVAAALVSAGCRQLGESRPQQLWEKASALANLDVRWHLIGHLQSNKVKRSLPLLSCVHSGDRTSILDAMNNHAAQQGGQVDVLLEVNVSGDSEKHGFAVGAAEQLAPQLDRWPHLNICGLMAMSARGSDSQGARKDFIRLRELREKMQAACPASIRLKHLSMGMSRDYEVAIEEGATMVRVGSALFAGVRP